MTLSQTGKSRRIAVLDGLRAMAIILVLMRHGVRPFWTDLEQPFLKLGQIEFGSVFINGWVGVDLFFVLSGYLISSHLLGRYFDPARKTMDLKTYAKRRFLRIAPAYYAILTIAVLGLFPFYPYPENYDNIFWRYAYHLLFLQDYLPSDINTVFWSLAIEIKFYLLAPFFLMALLYLPKTGWRIAAAASLMILMALVRLKTALGNPDISSYVSYFEDMRSIFHLTLDGLITGTLCALVWKDEKMRDFVKKPYVANGLFFAGFCAFLYTILLSGPLLDLGPSLYDKTFLVSVIALSFGAMLLGLLGGCVASGFFALRIWFPVALISYSLYLVHLPMMYPAEILCLQFFDLDAYSPQIQMLLYTPFFLALAFGAASLSYYFFERPFLAKPG